MNKLLLVSFYLLFLSCSSDNVTSEISTEEETEEDITPEPETVSDGTNVLLIIADDMGLDATPGFPLGTIKPNMPTLTGMMQEGVTFRNVWSNPTCTPTRGAIITGKYGFRTNVLSPGDELSISETSIQTYLEDNSSLDYSNAVIGKWHLANDVNHPTNMGVDYFTGFLGGAIRSYTSWDFIENGTTTTTTDYATTKFTNKAIDWISDQTQPWFLWLSYNAPHTPFHLPPNDLHGQGALPSDQASIDNEPLPYYMAMLEAMDTEIGRLLDAMSDAERENTIIIFIGDNGTPNQVAQAYGNRRNKDTVYQGGVNVPMVVCGKDVNRIGETEDALISVTDIFATIADIAETGTTDIHDSKSFKALFNDTASVSREFAYTEVGRDENTTDYAIRNITHKYLEFADGAEALYNLADDPLESQNLLSSSLSEVDAAEMQKLKEEVLNIKL